MGTYSFYCVKTTELIWPNSQKNFVYLSKTNSLCTRTYPFRKITPILAHLFQRVLVGGGCDRESRGSVPIGGTVLL